MSKHYYCCTYKHGHVGKCESVTLLQRVGEVRPEPEGGQGSTQSALEIRVFEI